MLSFQLDYSSNNLITLSNTMTQSSLALDTSAITPGFLRTPSVLAGYQLHQGQPAFGLRYYSIVACRRLDGTVWQYQIGHKAA